VYIGGGHRAVVRDTLDMLDRVYEGNSDGSRRGGYESREDDDELHIE
jgi:hypothetical protein